MDIQWYPGHMARAKRELQESLKLIDVVVEVVDARAPASSRNPDFDALFRNKTRVVLLNKQDLASPKATSRWCGILQAQGITAGAISCQNGDVKKRALAVIEQAAAPYVERMKKKGVNKVVRVMIAGIPNVGKSTLINRVAGQKRAQVGDRPGVTRSNQWVKITPFLELLDTPGLLWPKLENRTFAEHLAYIGSIKDDIMEPVELAGGLLMELDRICPDALRARYAIGDAVYTEPHAMLGAVARARTYVVSGGEPDYERMARIVLDEFRAGKIGRITLDQPETGETNAENA